MSDWKVLWVLLSSGMFYIHYLEAWFTFQICTTSCKVDIWLCLSVTVNSTRGFQFAKHLPGHLALIIYPIVAQLSQNYKTILFLIICFKVQIIILSGSELNIWYYCPFNRISEIIGVRFSPCLKKPFLIMTTR